MKRVSLTISILLLSILIAISSCRPGIERNTHEHRDHIDHHDDSPKGPHGGRLLTDNDFSLEIKIFEEGVPPEYHLYGYDRETPLKPTEFSVDIALTRLGGTIDKFSFLPLGDYLRSNEEVQEPHSFDVSVRATYKGKDHQWTYESYEGRTSLSDEAIKASDIQSERIGPASIQSKIGVNGQLRLNEDKLVHVMPRFPGVAKEIRKSLGDHVEKGEVLAVIESNQNLQSYEVRSQIAGTVIQRHITYGEFATEGRDIFVVADLSNLWADFRVYREDFSKVRVGQKITLYISEGRLPLEAQVTYLSPFGEEATQSRIVRAVVPNPDGSLYPELFIRGEIVVDEQVVPLAVKDVALQTFRDWTVVFLQIGNTFEVRPLVLGRSDGKMHEVLSGIKQNDLYVTQNSFIIKADILKSGASHDH